MVESIAFFEAYRPVLEGLQMLSPRDFPFKVKHLNTTVKRIVFNLNKLIAKTLRNQFSRFVFVCSQLSAHMSYEPFQT